MEKKSPETAAEKNVLRKRFELLVLLITIKFLYYSNQVAFFLLDEMKVFFFFDYSEEKTPERNSKRKQKLVFETFEFQVSVFRIFFGTNYKPIIDGLSFRLGSWMPSKKFLDIKSRSSDLGIQVTNLEGLSEINLGWILLWVVVWVNGKFCMHVRCVFSESGMERLANQVAGISVRNLNWWLNWWLFVARLSNCLNFIVNSLGIPPINQSRMFL